MTTTPTPAPISKERLERLWSFLHYPPDRAQAVLENWQIRLFAKLLRADIDRRSQAQPAAERREDKQEPVGGFTAHKFSLGYKVKIFYVR